MNCDAARRALSERCDARLRPADALELGLHLESCAACRHEAALLSHALDGLASAPAPEPRPGGWERLCRELERERAPRRARRALAYSLALAAAAAALAGAFLLRPPEPAAPKQSPVAKSPKAPAPVAPKVVVVERPVAPQVVAVESRPVRPRRQSAPRARRTPIKRPQVAAAPPPAPAPAPAAAATGQAGAYERQSPSDSMSDLISEGFALLVQADAETRPKEGEQL